jgi:hypothetical protein
MPNQKKQGYDHPKHRRTGKTKIDMEASLCKVLEKTCMKLEEAALDLPDINNRPAGDPSGVVLVTAYILPSQNELIEYVELYTDDGGNPGTWVGDLTYVETITSGPNAGKEKWQAQDVEIDEPHPVDEAVYHVVCWSTVHGWNSRSAEAG